MQLWPDYSHLYLYKMTMLGCNSPCLFSAQESFSFLILFLFIFYSNYIWFSHFYHLRNETVIFLWRDKSYVMSCQQDKKPPPSITATSLLPIESCHIIESNGPIFPNRSQKSTTFSLVTYRFIYLPRDSCHLHSLQIIKKKKKNSSDWLTFRGFNQDVAAYAQRSSSSCFCFLYFKL